MRIAVTCKSCLATFNVRAELAGKRGRCRRCGNIVGVPEVERSLLPRGASQRATRAVGRRSVSPPARDDARRGAANDPGRCRAFWTALGVSIGGSVLASLVFLLLYELSC